MERRRAGRLALWLGMPIILIAGLLAVWNWDWFIPLVQTRATAALGRPVHIQHLHLSLGRVTRAIADDVSIANPQGWDGPPFATAKHLIVDVDLWHYIRHGQLIVPLVALQQPRVKLVQTADGKANYLLQPAGSSGGSDTKIGNVRIEAGHVQAELLPLKADLGMDIATRETGDQPQVVVDARGTYGGAPIQGRLIGGALLSLRDAAHPWPVDLRLENGQTKVALVGTLQDPLHLKGADLKLQLAGQDMAQLEHLAGFPIPPTPPYKVTGQLDFADSRIRFRDFSGQVGSSDLEGTIAVDPGKGRSEVTADLKSRQVDLADLGGFLGAQPGRVGTPGQSAEKKAEVVQAEASAKLLPDRQISLPKLQWADIHLRYHGQQIKGRSVPLDDLTAVLDIVNGAVTLHPVSFGVGSGQIKATIALAPMPNNVMHAKVDLAFRHVDVSRLMSATQAFHGAGTISGIGNLDATGNSLAQLLGNGNGGLRLGMAGGDLSALLVNLSGLQFGNALLSALGVPERTQVECLVDDMALQHGILAIQALVLDTGEAIVNGAGAINLKTEAIDLQLRTDAKHFSIGSLPAPINIGGTLKSPSIRPGAELAARGGLAAGLGVLFAPLALLPTIQLGVGDDHRCDRILAQAKAQPGGQRLPPPANRETSR